MKKTEKMERGRMVIESGRDDSDYKVGSAREVKDTGMSKSMGKSNNSGSKDY